MHGYAVTFDEEYNINIKTKPSKPRRCFHCCSTDSAETRSSRDYSNFHKKIPWYDSRLIMAGCVGYLPLSVVALISLKKDKNFSLWLSLLYSGGVSFDLSLIHISEPTRRTP